MNRFQKLDQCTTVEEVQAWLAEQEIEFVGRAAELRSVRNRAANKIEKLERKDENDRPERNS